MKVVYKNLLETKQSVSIDLEDGVSVLINAQMYSEEDDQLIIYSNTPIFGNKGIVFLDIARACTFAIYNDKDNTVQYSDKYKESLEETLLTDEIYAIHSIDDISYLLSFNNRHSFEYSYEDMYIHNHPYTVSIEGDDLPF